jgi:stage III sporulation protein SpoIIIAA
VTLEATSAPPGPLPMSDRPGIEGFERVLRLLPGWMQDVVDGYEHGLEEIAIDIGQPLRLKVGDERIVCEQVVTAAEIDKLQNNFSFRSDNRAGLDGTLHRIARINNRYGVGIGVRIRFGRFIANVADDLWPFLKDGMTSLLLCGAPGGGKTTLLRAIVEMLGRRLRQSLVVVDTSCEICGDGDSTHIGLGPISRIQVSNPKLQGVVIMEALANLTPVVIVCDEIGYHDDIEQIQTASKREVGIVATAHGRDIHRILENERLSPLLGHYDARSRRRLTTPSFKSMLTIEEKGVYRLYTSLMAAIDDVAADREPESILLGPRREAYLAKQRALEVA